MTRQNSPGAERDVDRAQLPEDVRLLLTETEREAVPERLLILARKLQSALSERMDRAPQLSQD